MFRKIKSIDLDNLSYENYGKLTQTSILIVGLLIGIIPFPLLNIWYFIICFLSLQLYFKLRDLFIEPIHAYGLNSCYICTLVFYIMLFIIIKLSLLLVNFLWVTIIMVIIITISCYFTSTLPTKKDKNKLFFGKKKDKSEYQQIYTWVRYNQNDSRIIAFQENLKRDNLLYTIFMEVFINKTSLNKMADILNFKQDTSVLPYINRIVGKLSDTIYEVDQICREHQTDAEIKD